MTRHLNDDLDPRQKIESLESTFGCPFREWVHIDSAPDTDEQTAGYEWRPGFRTDSKLDSVDRVTAQFLNRALVSDQETFAECADDQQTRVAVRLTHRNEPQRFLVGTPKLDAAGWAKTLASGSMRGLNDRDEIEDLHHHIELFAEQMSHKLEELSWLRQLATSLEFGTASKKIEDVAKATFETLREVIDSEAIALASLDPAITGSDEIESKVSFPIWQDELAECDRRHLGVDFSRFVECAIRCASHQSFVWNLGGVTDRIPKHIVPQWVRSCVLVRIQSSVKDYGWLVAINKKPPSGIRHDQQLANAKTLGLDEFGTIEASFLEAAAGMLATHASNVQLFSDQKAFTVSVIRSLINVVDARDRYTCGHSDRVALMAKSLARHFGVKQEEQETIYLSGLLHDIGKIAVPDNILLKAGRLTDEEFDVIKTHPAQGVEILKHIKQFETVLPGVLYHHESVDGSGYPHGLKGDDIPFMGRLLAVVDAFDAMTTTRPYRNARTKAEAVAILDSGAGTQWDADLVACFFEHLDEIIAEACHWESHIAQLLAEETDPGSGEADSSKDATHDPKYT